jgi:hypothetical protein
MSINKTTIWGSALVTAGFAVFGWMGLQIYELNAEIEHLRATRFTAHDGERVRDEITDVTTDIDKRLALMENNVNWIREVALQNYHPEVGQPAMAPEPVYPPYLPITPEPSNIPNMPAPPVPSPTHQVDPEQIRKYDLRSKK